MDGYPIRLSGSSRISTIRWNPLPVGRCVSWEIQHIFQAKLPGERKRSRQILRDRGTELHQIFGGNRTVIGTPRYVLDFRLFVSELHRIEVQILGKLCTFWLPPVNIRGRVGEPSEWILQFWPRTKASTYVGRPNNINSLLLPFRLLFYRQCM